MNGAAALKIKKGDIVIIAGFELAEQKIKPRIVFVNENEQDKEHMKRFYEDWRLEGDMKKDD